MGWFTPKYVVSDEQKEWLENAFLWLIDEIGADILRSVEVILPIEEYFPEPFAGSPSDIRTMVERVCGYMDVDSAKVVVEFFADEDGSRLHPLAAAEETPRHAIGTYHMRGGRYIINLETNQASDPQVLVATIAHELGHVILLGEDRLDPDHPDHEPLTDLLTVFYGMGVFTANSVFTFEQWTNTFSQGWRAGRRGYLDEEMFGYALAMFAYVRNEIKPGWAGFLETNVKSYFKSNLKYLEKTGQTRLKKLDVI